MDGKIVDLCSKQQCESLTPFTLAFHLAEKASVISHSSHISTSLLHKTIPLLYFQVKNCDEQNHETACFDSVKCLTIKLNSCPSTV